MDLHDFPVDVQTCPINLHTCENGFVFVFLLRYDVEFPFKEVIVKSLPLRGVYPDDRLHVKWLVAPNDHRTTESAILNPQQKMLEYEVSMDAYQQGESYLTEDDRSKYGRNVLHSISSLDSHWMIVIEEYHKN